MEPKNIYKIAVDSLSAHVAILDDRGVILETNRAWREFALKNGYSGPADGIGMNYLEICKKSSRSPLDEAAVVGRGIRNVMAGKIDEFFIDYPCHSPTKKRWFALRVVRFGEPGSGKVIMTHENITPLIAAHEELKEKERLLRKQKAELEESNVALKVLLRHREEDKLQMEQNVLTNVRELLLPYLDKLLASPLDPRQRTFAELIRERLSDIVSPFLRHFTGLHALLSPREIEVATMVREGRSSQEIADALGVSISAVDFHRKRLRNKLGLTKSGKNLRSFLLSLR